MQQQDFAGRPGAAIVTGGSGGLGAAVCRMLAQRGSDVALTFHRNADAAKAVLADVEKAGRKGLVQAVTLEDAAATAAFLQSVVDTFGGIHTVVHAAGPHVRQTHISKVLPDEFRRQVEQEVVAFFNLVQPALVHLRQTQGSIVAITTAATRRYPLRDGLSAGPKGAIESTMRAIAAEEGRFGVRANCVGPGMLLDGMAERLIASGDLDERALESARTNIPMRKFGSALDIAEATCFLASERAGYITGMNLDVDGGFHL